MTVEYAVCQHTLISSGRKVSGPCAVCGNGDCKFPAIDPKPVTRAAVLNNLEQLELPQNRNRLEVLQSLVVEWANYALPHRTPEKAIAKLVEEVGELFRDPRSESEWGDVFILCLDLAKFFGIDPHDAIVAAVKKNLGRTWRQGEFGTYHHQE